MARKMTEWPSKRGPITKIMPSDGCKGDTVSLAVGRWCIRVWEEVVQRLQTQARDAGMNGDLPDYLSRLFKRAVAAGHGEEDIAALIKVLRGE